MDPIWVLLLAESLQGINNLGFVNNINTCRSALKRVDVRGHSRIT